MEGKPPFVGGAGVCLITPDFMPHVAQGHFGPHHLKACLRVKVLRSRSGSGVSYVCPHMYKCCYVGGCRWLVLIRRLVHNASRRCGEQILERQRDAGGAEEGRKGGKRKDTTFCSRRSISFCSLLTCVIHRPSSS